MKNEGNKRRMISDDQRHRIVEIYAAAENDEMSRMLDYRTFGYRRIRVLRPLRMALHIHADSLARLKAEKTWAKLTSAQQAAWEAALQPHLGTTQPLSWAESFVADTAAVMPAVGKVTKAVVKALVNALGERDPASEPVVDADGQTVADPALTDYENVSLMENVGDYFAREVLPHVPDAWIDETYRDPQDGGVGRVGYEINFNRYFYQYIPPRPLEAIDADLQQIEAEIAALLGEVTE
jgi:type I restriction enzyme M protein